MSNTIHSATVLVQKAINDPAILEKLKIEPEKTLHELEQVVVNQIPRPLESDRWVYRIVVISLGMIGVLVVLGSIAISFSAERNVPDVLTALGSASIGALAGLLAPSPRG